MKRLLLIALSLVASCDGKALVAEEVTDSVKSYFSLPDRALVVLGEDVSESQISGNLQGLAVDCCTGALRSRLLQWFSSASIRGDVLHDDMQSMRPIGEPQCLPATFIGSRSASVTCTIETSESYSLSRNLDSVADLFKQFKIRNADSDDIVRQVEEADLPELVELMLKVRKTVELQIQAVDDKWLVSDANIRTDFAEIEVQRP